jgi:3-hydroxyisobutyrate dehydrogenase
LVAHSLGQAPNELLDGLRLIPFGLERRMELEAERHGPTMVDRGRPVRKCYAENMQKSSKDGSSGEDSGAASGEGSGRTACVLGLGAMGQRMAKNLAEKGFSLRVWNRTHLKVEQFLRTVDSMDARSAPTPAACVQGAEVVVTMVSDRTALESVLAGPEGVVEGLSPGQVLVDMSTIGRAAALAMASAIEAVGARFVDAPVSGSVGPAAKGQLVALVGARPEDLEVVRPFLLAMCERIVHAGGVGQGAALKVVLNAVGSFHLVAFTSMLVVGQRAGLSREAIIDAFTSGAFASPSYVNKRSKILARDYSPEFSLSLALKDSGLAMDLQREVGIPIAAFAEVRREMEEAVLEGLGPEDLYALEKHFLAQ